MEIVPGLTAALSGGAVLGAPLAHDFCVISLSDRLTPWEVIEKRLACAAMGDFCVALYNPSSKGRPDYLAKAVHILLENGKSADTVCGIVRNIGREGQTARILTLAQLESTAVDMFTTVYIGNAATKQLGGRMVTPRGTADEGSGFQRHDRGTGVLPAAGGAGRTGAGQRSHPAGRRRAGQSGRHYRALRAADHRRNDRSFAGRCLVRGRHPPLRGDATKNIRAACNAAGVEYHRLLRAESPLPAGSMVFATAAHAAAFLAGCSGNVLLATGAKELTAFAALNPERLFPRVLPTRDGIAACEDACIPHRNIIAMQGPFSYALNCALMKQFSIRYLVTKDGGAVGGFAEKAQAAQDTGAQLIVVRRPAENGQTAAQILTRCKEVLV